MGRGLVGGLIGVTILAGGSVIGRSKRKKQEAERQARADANPFESPLKEAEYTPLVGKERKCKVCGSIDTSGAKMCPVCFNDFE